MQAVLFSVSYAGLWGQDRLSPEEFIPHARELGYQGVELMGKRPHLSPLDWDRESAAAVKKLCGVNSLDVACIAAYTNFTGGMDAREVPFRDMQVQYVVSLARLAEALGCGLIRVFTSYERDDMLLYDQWNRTVSAIQECCDRCAPLGVTIGIQNHHDVAVHSKALAEFLNDVNRPNCKLMFDCWSPCLRGEDVYEAAKRMAPNVVYTTMADYIRMPRFRYQQMDLTNYLSMPVDVARAVPMGDGEIDNAGFLRGLREGGYDGPVAYEMCSQLRGGGRIENLDYCARRFLQWLGENWE